MPKVKEYSFSWDGKPFQQIFTVDSHGVFKSNLPPGFLEVVGFDHVTGKTLADCEAAVKAARELFKTSKTTIKKVILYTVATSGYIMQKGRCVFDKREFGAKGLSISVMVGVFEESATETGHNTRYDYKPIEETSLPYSLCRSSAVRELYRGRGERAENQLDWTPELEDIFRRVGLGLEAVILQLDQLNDPKKILTLAASISKLLPAAGEAS